MGKMDKNVALVKILEAVQIYEQELNNKNYLILAKNQNNVISYSLVFSETNFLHFTGVKSSLSASDFYKIATTRKLRTDDFVIENDFLVKKKLNVLTDAVRFPKTAKMIGEFRSAGIKIKADIGSGNPNYVMAFRKDSHNKNIYVPVSVMEDDVRMVTSPSSPIVAILRKNKREKQYNELTYKSKNINFDKLHIPKELKNIISENILNQLVPQKNLEEIGELTKETVIKDIIVPEEKKQEKEIKKKKSLSERIAEGKVKAAEHNSKIIKKRDGKPFDHER